jgi:aromatic ring-opening dioxygenase catalytic subunit (LigB family)
MPASQASFKKPNTQVAVPTPESRCPGDLSEPLQSIAYDPSMAKIVGVYATGHAPNLVTTWERAGEDVCRQTLEAFAEIGRRIQATGCTTVITISNDHFNNFFLNNFPAYAIGVADTWIGPEDDLRYSGGLVNIPGSPALAKHIVQHLYEHESFDPSVSHFLKLDHGTFVPIRYALPEFNLPLIPTFQNCIQPPMPTMARAAAFGVALRRAVEAFPGDERVVVIGAGGMSHFIGVPGQGRVNEAFDQRWVSLFKEGNPAGLTSLTPAEMFEGGNGAEEIRNWISAMACAEGRPAEWLMYAPVPAWLIGMGVVDFHYESR